MIKVSSYVKLSSLKRALTERAAEDGAERPVYMLPSKSNEDLLLGMLRGEGDFFAAKPEVWSWQDLYNVIVPKEERRRCIDPPDHNLAVLYVMEQIVALFDDRNISLPPGVRKKSFARTLGETIRELMLEDVSPEMIARAHEDSGVSSPYLPGVFYEAYRTYLADNGLADNAEIPSLTANAIGESLPKTLTGRVVRFVGFMSFTGSQLKLLKRLGAAGLEMEFFMPNADLPGFRDAASQLGAFPEDIETGTVYIKRTAAADIYSEYEHIAGVIAASDEREDAGALVPPGHAWRLAQTLTRHGIPWQIRSEVTVADSALGDFASRVWETHKLGWPPSRALHLFRSSPAALEPDLDKFTMIMPEGLTAWREFFASDENAAQIISRAESFCALLSDDEGHTPEELLRGFAALFGGGEWENRVAFEIMNQPELDSAVREISSARLEIEAKIAMMEDVKPALGEASSVRFAGDDAIDFLRQWAAEAALALPPKMTGAVSIYDGPPPILANHDLWIMADVDSSRYPGPVPGQPMLDDTMRERLNAREDEYSHLPTLREKRRQKEALFRRMLALGESSTVITRPLNSGTEETPDESPFLKTAKFKDSPRWTLEDEIELAGTTPEIEAADRNRQKASADEPAKDKKQHISASGIDTLEECPFAWWLTAKSRLGTISEPDGLFGNMTLGNISHSIWERVAAALAEDGDKTHRVVMESKWEDILSGLSEKYPLLSDSRSIPAIGTLKGKMLNMADKLDEAETAAKKDGLKKIRIRTEAALPELEFEHFILHGRADRIDYWKCPGGEEAAIIYDYKLGSSSRYKKRLQLAVYAAMLETSGTRAAGYCYLCHKDGRNPGAWRPDFKKYFTASPNAKPPDCGEKISDALERLAEIDKIAGEGKFEANYDSPSCALCEYSTVCRRGETYRENAEEDETEDAHDY